MVLLRVGRAPPRVAENWSWQPLWVSATGQAQPWVGNCRVQWDVLGVPAPDGHAQMHTYTHADTRAHGHPPSSLAPTKPAWGRVSPSRASGRGVPRPAFKKAQSQGEQAGRRTREAALGPAGRHSPSPQRQGSLLPFLRVHPSSHPQGGDAHNKTSSHRQGGRRRSREEGGGREAASSLPPAPDRPWAAHRAWKSRVATGPPLHAAQRQTNHGWKK